LLYLEQIEGLNHIVKEGLCLWLCMPGFASLELTNFFVSQSCLVGILERERESPPLLSSMSNLQAAASGLWRAEETASAAAPGKWIPSCAYNGFRVSRSNNRAKTLFMHTRVFSDLSLNHRHQCRGFRCKSSCSVSAMTISSSSSE